MIQPFISIIVPVYNTEKYLEQCLLSLTGQSLNNIEIICIDDGSTDNSGKILDRFAEKDRRIRVVHKKNEGYGATMNRGLDMARGEYTGILESDDFAEKDMYEKLWEEAVKQDAEIVKCNYFEYDGESRERKKFRENLKGLPYGAVFSAVDKPQIFQATPSIWSGIYKRNFLVGNHIRFPETPGASYQDKSFAFKVLVCASRVCLDRGARMNYRTDNGNSSVNSTGKVFCVCDVMEDCENFLSGKEKTSEELFFILEGMRIQTYLWNYNRIGPEYQYAFLLKMREEFIRAQATGRFRQEYMSIDNYNRASAVIQDMEQYFNDTSKMEQHRKNGRTVKNNLEVYGEWFCRELKEAEQVVIYGAGTVGRSFYSRLRERQIADGRIVFAVTAKKQETVEKEFPEIVEIAELAERADKCVVVVAVRDKFQGEITETLKGFSFPKVICLDLLLQSALGI